MVSCSEETIEACFMQELTLKEHQLVMLDILKDIHSFCEEHKILYSIAWGTLIGAVRHKGFIPWDDDVDVVLPRPVFERFCKEYRSDKYRLIYYGNDRTALGAFARVVDCTRTEYRNEHPWTAQPSGVFVDVFALDGLPSLAECKYFYKKMKPVKRLFYMFRRQNHHFAPNDSFMSIAITVIARIIGFGGRLPYLLLKRFVSEMERYKYEDCEYFSTLACLEIDPVVLLKEDFEDTVLLDFEDTRVRAMKGYDRVLRQVFGDYMQYPPVEERVPCQNGNHFYWKMSDRIDETLTQSC